MNDGRTTYRGNLKHELVDILFLVISAAVCGLNDWVEIELFGKGQLPWLRKFFPFRNGVPSHDTLGRVFSKLDTEEFSRCFSLWVNELGKHTSGELIAIDGKRMRGSYDKSDGKSALHIVSAYATEQRLCLQQVATDEKSNEITAIPKLLEMLSLEGCTVSIDAMGCQRAISEKIITKEADYILGVKNNQKGLYEQIEKVFGITATDSQDDTHEMGHGRFEQRKCSVISDLTHFDDYKDWPGIKSLVRIESSRTNRQSGKEEQQTRYYISSKLASAKIFNGQIREHWHIENKLHWVLDVDFQEDKSRKRKGHSAINFNMIAKIALGLIEGQDPKKPRSQKRTIAAFDPNYREKLLRI